MVSRIVGLSRWGGPISAYLELTGAQDAEPRNSAMSRGLALEDSVLAMGRERHLPGGWTLKPPQVRSDVLPHAHASVDEFWWTDDGRTATVVDAKTLSLHDMGEDWGPDGSDRLPSEYMLQGLWYLGTCRAAGMNVANEALFPTLVGPEAEFQWAARLVTKTGRPLALADIEGTGLELRTYRVAWDADLFEEVNRKVVTFLREHVEPRRPPEPGPGELLQRDVRAVAKSLRAEAGRVLEFDQLQPDEQALVLELLDANRQRKAWDRTEEQAAARVRLLMGTAEEVRGLPGGARVAWKESQAGVRRFEVREPRK